MMRISKSHAMNLYLLSENDLESVPFITKPNYLNSQNNIKLYKKNDIIDLAINKYGSIESLSKKVEIKEKKKMIRINKSNDNKDKRKKELLKYFESNGFIDYNDILSEYPCYLYIEYNKRKFMNEVSNNIDYNIKDVFTVASERINKRKTIFNYMKENKIKYKPENNIINDYINGEYNLNETKSMLEEEEFFNNKTIYNTIIEKNNYTNLDNEDINEIKNDCIYYYLISENCLMSFPKTVKERVNNIVQIIIFIKENINIDLTNNKEQSYDDFIKMINKRDSLLNNIRQISNIPEEINTRLNNNSDFVYNN